MNMNRTAALILSLTCCTGLAVAQQSGDPTKSYQDAAKQAEKAKQDSKKAADDAKKAYEDAKKTADGQGQPAGGGQPDNKAMMEMYMKAFAPSEHHKVMSPMLGHWDAEVWAQMDPASPPMTSKGTSDNTWTMGDRVLKQEFKGSMMGMNFEGLGYVSYNAATGKYESVWMDSMAGSMTTSSGTLGADKKTWTFEGTESDPMTKQTLKTKDVVVITDKDHHSFTRYYIMPDAKEMKGMEIKYTRSAANPRASTLPALKSDAKPATK